MITISLTVVNAHNSAIVCIIMCTETQRSRSSDRVAVLRRITALNEPLAAETKVVR